MNGVNVTIVQPPLVQPNTPYPSGAYLKSFFKNLGCRTEWKDLSIQLFRKIFSAEGMTEIFSRTEEKAIRLAQSAEKNGDEFTGISLRTYILQKEKWISSASFVMDLLCGNGSRELCHDFVFSPHAARGNRMKFYAQNLNRDLTVDDSRNLASLFLMDFADYVSFVFDENFSLVRYAERISCESDFSSVEKILSSPVLNVFYKKILEENFADFFPDEFNLVCISVPFAGTFAPALFTGKFLKEKFGEKIFVSIGGGFVSTELREFRKKNFFRYADSLSFDRGYGSYKNLLDQISGKNFTQNSVYKMRIFSAEKILEPVWKNQRYEEFENRATSEIFPDYSSVDFSIYPRCSDDENPMQRLWSDGAWMKAYLAHGCYWHRCSFCDTQLDYVSFYKNVCVEKLFRSLENQSEKNRIRGIHFVDEAMPPVALKKFSWMNLRSQKKFSFWGNVRFEKIFRRDLTDFLSFGGLLGVTGGIEIATQNGLDSVKKGTDLDAIVGACCAFKESGIFVHAYMIYGFFGESETDTINSMETLRQFFAEGILDSAFWHKFVLTKNSRIYAEWKNGMHADLQPEEISSEDFLHNELNFRGEEKSKKFGRGLSAALDSWMHGEKISRRVNDWFDFKTPLPTVSKNLVKDAIVRYEKNRDEEFAKNFCAENSVWLGGNLISCGKKIFWNYMQENFSLTVPDSFAKNSAEFLDALKFLSPEKFDASRMKKILEENSESKKFLKKFRGKGLAVLGGKNESE